jgi:hypothetical protein
MTDVRVTSARMTHNSDKKQATCCWNRIRKQDEHRQCLCIATTTVSIASTSIDAYYIVINYLSIYLSIYLLTYFPTPSFQLHITNTSLQGHLVVKSELREKKKKELQLSSMSTLAPTSTFVVNHHQLQQQQQHQQSNNQHHKVINNNNNNNNTVHKGHHHEGNNNNNNNTNNQQQHPNDENMNTMETLLPTDLEKILAEVARNGGCSWLTWLGKAEQQTQVVRNIKRIKRRRDTHGSYVAVKNGANKNSEFEDSTHQYEYDSEGTSTTSNSEDIIVVAGSGEQQTLDKRQQLLTNATTARNTNRSSTTNKYTSLGHAFSEAIALVLDHSYRQNGGYKLSPAEVRKYQTGAHEIFQQRRCRLMALVVTNNKNGGLKNGNVRNGPPFTIQRLAEVLLSPARYYRQTHKLCNCMEKLLLVTSSIHAFGGITGGQTSQSRREVSSFV